MVTVLLYTYYLHQPPFQVFLSLSPIPHPKVASNSNLFLPYEGLHPISFESPPKLIQTLGLF